MVKDMDPHFFSASVSDHLKIADPKHNNFTWSSSPPTLLSLSREPFPLSLPGLSPSVVPVVGSLLGLVLSTPSVAAGFLVGLVELPAPSPVELGQGENNFIWKLWNLIDVRLLYIVQCLSQKDGV